MSEQPHTPTNRIEIRALVKRFQHQPVLDQLSLTINDGEFCILVGDNGAGKTTLLRLLAGLARPTQGEVTITGATTTGDLRWMIGYVGHQPMVYQDLTACENLRHYASLYHVTPMEEAVEQALRINGLSDHQNQPVRTLSRGMQQRLSLARALLHNPAILLFDEPYTGLDQQSATFLDTTLQNLHTPGRVILLAAHRPQRLLGIASHVAWLKAGVISQHLAVHELSTAPELLSYLQEAA